MFHQMLSRCKKHHTLMLITVELQLFPDNGQYFTNLEGSRHQEPILDLVSQAKNERKLKILKSPQSLLWVAHLTKRHLMLGTFLILLSALNNQRKLVRILCDSLSRPLLSLLFIT